MKQSILTTLAILFIGTSFSQLTDGEYKYSKVTVSGGVITAVDSLLEMDPTVDGNVKSLTTADVNRYNDAVNKIYDYPSWTTLVYYINYLWIPQNTDGLSEGGSNFYWTSSRFNSAFAAKSTSDLSEGSNLYYTNTRFDTRFTSKTTDNLMEGLSNRYFSNSLARNAFSVSGPLAYNSSTGIFGISQAGSSLNGYLSSADWNTFNGKFNSPSGTPFQYIRGDGSLATLPAGTIYTAGSGINIVSNVVSNSSPDQTVTLTAGRGIAITGTYPNFTVSLATPTISIVSRSLNSNFTPSTTKEVVATYTVTCSVTNPLLIGTSSSTAFLEYSLNGGTTWLTPSQVGNSSGVGITVAIQLTNGQTGTLVGVIPANALTRIRTTTSGTASVTYITGQETSY